MPKTQRKTTARRAPAPPTPSQDWAVMIWLFAFACSVALLVLWGGYTRLTRSGLSIVEWNPISGAIPPIGAQAWQEEFSKYKQTPEFQQVNSGMTLEEYQFIFYIEWIHRALARAIGLLYAIPMLYFLATKRIPLRAAGAYIGLGLLFICQAFAGWFMVASGLEQRPSVSHYLLTFHLLLALTLIGLSLWIAFDHLHPAGLRRAARPSLTTKLAAATLILLLVQITYGGLTAGLKAGHISDTWPWMSGRLIPPDLLSALHPWTLRQAQDSALSLVEAPQTVAFIHRWLAFAVLGMAVALYLTAHRSKVPREAQHASFVLVGLVSAQVLVGISVVIFHVRMELALVHQAMAIGLLAVTLFTLHRSRAADQSPAATR